MPRYGAGMSHIQPFLREWIMETDEFQYVWRYGRLWWLRVSEHSSEGYRPD